MVKFQIGMVVTQIKFIVDQRIDREERDHNEINL